jgi:protoheme IX farnesyltransferase
MTARLWRQAWAWTWTRLADFVALTKLKQTALLLITGLCAYALTHGWPFEPLPMAGMAAGLFFSISGCTVLNMLLDRDVDARMGRTRGRPLPSSRIQVTEAALFGGALSLLGLGFSFGLGRSFGLVIAAGFFFDLVVYTAWLKRRTALSILLGGVAGGMPVLAGRVLALGRVDLVGLLLAGSVLLWVPSHILTLALRYGGDYRRAGVPVWPNVYGRRSTHSFIAGANLLNVLVLMACALFLRVHVLALIPLLAMGLAMFGLSMVQLIDPDEGRNWLLFKAASLYMLASSLLLTVGGLL